MRRNWNKHIAVLLLLTMLLALCAGCADQTPNPQATITFKNYGSVVINLYPDKAPNTVANFISLANSGFYDGLTIHRVISRFIIQGGDPNGDGTGGPGYTIDGEFSNNGFSKNDISHEAYVISMARFGSGSDPDDKASYNTAGSQFFITLSDKTNLDGDYAAFGKVFTGMSVIDKIGEVKVDSNGKPKEDVIIESIVVETYGKDYGAPKTTPIE